MIRTDQINIRDPFVLARGGNPRRDLLGTGGRL